MRKKHFKEELMRSTIIYLLILFAVLFVITSYFYGSNIVSIKTTANENFLSLMHSQTIHFLEHPVAEVLTIESQLKQNLEEHVSVEADYHGYVYRIEQLNEMGLVEDSYPIVEERIGMDLSQHPFINTLKENDVQFSDTYVDTVSEKVVMLAGKKLSSGGYLIGFMDLSKLQNAFSTFNQHGGLFAIVDKKGQYILHPQDDVVDTRTIDPNTKDIRTGTIGSGDLVTLFGTKYFVQYREIERTGWYLLIYQNYKTSMTSIVASVITVIALMILVFFMMSRTFNRSFSKLEKNVLGYIAMTKKVIAGDYESVSMDQEFIEFDELSKSFSAMIHEVEVREEEILKYNAELEESQNELRSSNDEIFATLQQLMAIERELNQQNIYLDEQNIKLSNFIDGLNAGTWEWDITTGIILINERWGEMIGFQMDEIYPLTSEKFFECVHPEDLKRLNEDLKDTMDGKTLYFETKFRLRHKYMDWVWVHSIAKVIKRDKSQLPLLMSGIHIDISDSVANELKIEERLKETKLIADFTSSILTENSETIFESIGDLLDQVCKIKSHNSWGYMSFEEKFEIKSFEKLDHFNPLLQTAFFLEVEKETAGEKKYENQNELYLDASEYPFLEEFEIECLVCIPIDLEQERIGYIGFELQRRKENTYKEEGDFYRLLVNTIIESIKKDIYEKGLILSKEIANSANEAKSQFLANISHEIRTPLNGISGYLQLITQTERPDDIQEYAEMAVKVTQGMGRLIDDILDFSRIEAGKLKLINEPVDIRVLIRDIKNMYQYEAKNKNVLLTYEVHESVPLTIMTDATRLKQIISNLVSNAIKFAKDGSVFINVNVDMTLKDKPQIVIIISDNGIGIPNAQLKAIFDPFNQGDNSNTRQYGGTGLGLAIVKQLVDLFSGTVEVESFPERGTSFDVRIPLVNALYSPLKDHEAVLINRAEVQSPYVLVVDDNEINQMVVKKVLEIKGFVCDIARNGAEAVKAIQNNNYDCVFMDVQMPVMDGYEATRTIRRLDHKQNVFIVAMTANAMSGDREKCLAAGMDDYISKPLNYDLMVNLVRDRRDV